MLIIIIRPCLDDCGFDAAFRFIVFIIFEKRIAIHVELSCNPFYCIAVRLVKELRVQDLTQDNADPHPRTAVELAALFV